MNYKHTIVCGLQMDKAETTVNTQFISSGQVISNFNSRQASRHYLAWHGQTNSPNSF